MDKTLKDKYNVGDEIEVLISKPKIGTFPIGKFDTNVVCLFEKTKKFFEIGSTWLVSITKVNDHNLMISPIRMVKSKEQEDAEFALKLEELKNKYKK